MLDLIIHRACLNGKQELQDIACRDGRFVDSHFHMDAALSIGQPRLNDSGTLLEGIAEMAPYLDLQLVAFPRDDRGAFGSFAVDG